MARLCLDLHKTKEFFGIAVRMLSCATRREIDLDPKKPGLQVEFTVIDPIPFTKPWSAVVTYRPLNGDWVEVACAQNNGLYFQYGGASFPHADKPDF